MFTFLSRLTLPLPHTWIDFLHIWYVGIFSPYLGEIFLIFSVTENFNGSCHKKQTQNKCFSKDVDQNLLKLPSEGHKQNVFVAIFTKIPDSKSSVKKGGGLLKKVNYQNRFYLFCSNLNET